MKLPEVMCTCSARISSNFTPATRLRGLQEGGRQREREVVIRRHSLETSHLKNYPPPLCLFSLIELDSCSLLLAGQANPTPQGLDGFLRLRHSLLVSDYIAILLS